ncbi:TRAP transporter small permease [Desulfogranum mediterraneum]|uniref:TRAP transporter small permease n=1 Tax=Desulfogranum mediterraneum TaxID=160661 RepID=UPI0003FC0A02|nr:TRAP transporter small permease [Desulfogranum mediterraneum]
MFLRVLSQVEEALISLLLIATTLLVFLDVVMRFGFNTGFMWTQELTLHMSAWFVLFGTSYGIKVGSHIGVDAFVKLFPRGMRRLITCVACILSLCYCGLILYGSWIYLAKMKKIGIELEDLPIPTWLAHGMLLVGFSFISIRILLLLWQVVIDEADGFRHVDEAKESMEIVEELKEEEVTP